MAGGLSPRGPTPLRLHSHSFTSNSRPAKELDGRQGLVEGTQRYCQGIAKVKRWCSQGYTKVKRRYRSGKATVNETVQKDVKRHPKRALLNLNDSLNMSNSARRYTTLSGKAF